MQPESIVTGREKRVSRKMVKNRGRGRREKAAERDSVSLLCWGKNRSPNGQLRQLENPKASAVIGQKGGEKTNMVEVSTDVVQKGGGIKPNFFACGRGGMRNQKKQKNEGKKRD